MMKEGREWCLGEAKEGEVVGGQGAAKDAPYWFFRDNLARGEL